MLSSLITIGLMHWAVLMVPGANVLVVTELAARGDRRAACFAGFGIATVAVIWSCLAIAGLHAALVAHPQLKNGLQLLGGCYLFWLAFRMWRLNGGMGMKAESSIPPFAAFRLGFLTNIMNPKSILFFGSLFTTVLPAKPSQVIVIEIVFLVLFNALAWHLLLAVSFSHARVRHKYAGLRVPIGRFTSMLLCLFGLRLISLH